MDGLSRRQRDLAQIVPAAIAKFAKIYAPKSRAVRSHFRARETAWNLFDRPGVIRATTRDRVAQANISNPTSKRFGRCWSAPMYRLSSYVLGSMMTALILTPFVSGPDRSFVGSLLATSAPESIVSVNRTLKGDRATTHPAANSMLADHSSIRQSIMPKNTALPASTPVESGKPPAAENRMMDGCESAFSEITDRQLADIPGRCIAALPNKAIQLATLEQR